VLGLVPRRHVRVSRHESMLLPQSGQLIPASSRRFSRWQWFYFVSRKRGRILRPWQRWIACKELTIDRWDASDRALAARSGASRTGGTAPVSVTRGPIDTSNSMPKAGPVSLNRQSAEQPMKGLNYVDSKRFNGNVHPKRHTGKTYLSRSLRNPSSIASSSVCSLLESHSRLNVLYNARNALSCLFL